MSSSPDPDISSMEGSEKNFYRSPLIAMSFFAVLFFIILVAIVVLWCIKRRQTEVKTVVIQPKRRPQSTVKKPVPQTNGGHQANGNGDVEAAAAAVINTDEIELSDNSAENKPHQVSAEAVAPSITVTSETDSTNENTDNTASANQVSEPQVEVKVDTNSDNQESADTAPLSPVGGDWQVVDKGETNPSFEKGDDE